MEYLNFDTQNNTKTSNTEVVARFLMQNTLPRLTEKQQEDIKANIESGTSIIDAFELVGVKVGCIR